MSGVSGVSERVSGVSEWEEGPTGLDTKVNCCLKISFIDSSLHS